MYDAAGVDLQKLVEARCVIECELVCLSVEMCRVVWCPKAVMRTQTARS